MMHSLVSDLAKDIERCEAYQIPVNIQHQQSVESLINLLLTDSLEGIGGQLPSILSVENYAPTTSTYSSMKSSGNLSLIEDLGLQKDLADYYEGAVIESIKKGEYQVEFFTNELLTWLVSNADLSEMKLLNNSEAIVLSNKLLIYGSLIAQKVEAYEAIVEGSKKLKQQIESKLDEEGR